MDGAEGRLARRQKRRRGATEGSSDGCDSRWAAATAAGGVLGGTVLLYSEVSRENEGVVEGEKERSEDGVTRRAPLWLSMQGADAQRW